MIKEYQKIERKTFVAFILALIFFCSSGRVAVSDEFLSPPKESEAYKQYLRRPKSELSKILYLIDRFKNTAFKIIYDGDEYDSNFATMTARQFLAFNYRNETAERWVKTHTYVSEPEGRVIHIKYPNGELRPARDVLLEELEKLEHPHP